MIESKENSNISSRPSLRIKVFEKPICGDLFCSSPESNRTSIVGMTFKSKMPSYRELVSKSDQNKENMHTNINKVSPTRRKTSVDMNDEDCAEVMDNSLDPKQQLALTIKNWSNIPANDENLLNEGALEALISLSANDDFKIKKCCAGAFHALSSRSRNRGLLISKGATSGILNIVLGINSWSMAKLSAICLSNLSIESGLENILTKDSCCFAIVILIGLEKGKLLPICLQTLYNLTCVDNFYNGMEKISKVIISLPQLHNFDPTLTILKTLANYVRFESLRYKIVEEGSLSLFPMIVSSIHQKSAKLEICFLICTIYRSLSETKACRTEMLSKNCIEILYQLLQITSEEGYRLIIKTLHNMLKIVQFFPSAIFQVAVDIAAELINKSKSKVCQQYCSECLYILTNQEKCRKPRIVSKIIISVSKLLVSNDELTQFNSFNSCGNIFFRKLCDDASELEYLLKKFIECGALIKDPNAIVGLPLALAKLSQEEVLFEILMRHSLIVKILDLSLSILEKNPSSSLVQLSCIVSSCRSAVKVNNLDNERKVKLSKYLDYYLKSENEDVLLASIESIRALIEINLCTKQLLSDELLCSISDILTKFKDHPKICMPCCEIFAIFSYELESHATLSKPELLKILYEVAGLTEINYIKIMITTCLCNTSYSCSSREALIDAEIISVLSNLSCSTNEMIQELCARCICNLTCVDNKHQEMINQNILTVIEMICQVRSISKITANLCARSLLNLMTNENFPHMIQDNVIRCFSSIVSSDCLELTCNLCARAFLIISSKAQGRIRFNKKIPALEQIFGLINAKETKTHIVISKACFNMLGDPNCRIAAIEARALSVLKIAASLNNSSISESIGQTLIVISSDERIHKKLLKEPIIEIILLLLSTTEGWPFECAIQACAAFASFPIFRATMIDKGVITSIVNCFLVGKVHDYVIGEAIARCLCFLSFVKSYCDNMITGANIMLPLNLLELFSCSSVFTGSMVVITLRNLSSASKCGDTMIQQHAIRLIGNIMRSLPIEQSFPLCQSAILVMQNLAKYTPYHSLVIQEGVLMEVLLRVASIISNDDDQRDACFDQLDVSAIVGAMDLMSASPATHQKIVSSGVVTTFKSLLSIFTDQTRFLAAKTICNLSSSIDCREMLVQQGAIQLIIAMINATDDQTKQQCATTLGYLSEYTSTEPGMVDALLKIGVKSDKNAANKSPAKIIIKKKWGKVKDVNSSAKNFREAAKTKVGQKILLNDDEDDLNAEIDLDQFQISRDRVFSREDIEVMMTDEDVLIYDYSDMEFQTISHISSPVDGGVAEIKKLDTIYPSLPDSLDNVPKAFDLIPVPIVEKSLPKSTIMFDFKADNFTELPPETL